MRQKLILLLKIISVYWLTILISIILCVFLHMPISLVIFLPISIIFSNKYTEKDRFKLRELNAKEQDMEVNNNIIQKILYSIKTLLVSSNQIKPDSNDEKINYNQYYKPKRYITTMKLCIELDDRTHRKRTRVERDEFLNELFEQLGINFLRYPVYSVYYKETLKNRILEKMQDHCYID